MSRSAVAGLRIFRGRSSLILVACVVFLLPSWVWLVTISAAASQGGEDNCLIKGSGTNGHLFDCRAYELVSPPYKEGFPVQITGISEDGSSVLAQSPGTFSAPEGTTPFGQVYQITRNTTGWETSALAAPSSVFSNYAVEDVSPNFQSSLWFAAPPQSSVRGVYIGAPSGPLTRVGPAEPGNDTIRSPAFIGDSDDFQHILFSVPSPFVGGESTSLWPGDTTTSGTSLYEYEYAGKESSEPRLVGVSNVGVPGSVGAGHLISDCGTYLGSFPEGEAYNAISSSGTTVFFTAAACGGAGPPVDEVYARINGEKTIAISEPSLSVPGRECTGVCATAENEPGERKAGGFAGASQDGSKVFFTTAQSLVNGDTDSGVDLYEADIREGSISHLVQVSRGGPGDPTPGTGANVLGVARVSEDGSHVYFVAEGALAGANGEGKTPVSHQPNLYVFSSECPGGGTACGSLVDHIAFVATLSGSDGGDWGSVDRRPVQATPGGDFLVFQSTANLTLDQEGNEAGQVFEYDAHAETLVRVSRGREGYNNDGNSNLYRASIPAQDHEIDRPIFHVTNLAVSADGARVVFTSEDALTPQAVNGLMNVYEYHDGQVGLISDGHDIVLTNGHPAVELLGIDESGLDVFFTTADRLAVQDADDQVDVYDARVEGGFSSEVQAPCGGDSCQDPSTGAPALLVPATASILGEVVPPKTSKAAIKSTKKKKTAKKKTKRGKKLKVKHKRGHKARRAGHRSRVTRRGK